MARWQVNQARNHWSDVLDQAETEGPQIITHHGKERAVVLSIDSYRSLRKEEEPKGKPDLISFLLSGPKFDIDDADFARNYTESDRHLDTDDLVFASSRDDENASS
jgi:antitoxin Phd